MNLRPPYVAASTHTSAFNAIAFQSPVMPNTRMSLCTQSVHSLSFPPRPLRTAASRFPNMIRFLGSRPPLIRMSVPAHRSILVRNVVLMLSHRDISRTRLYEVILWSGLLRCAPMMRSIMVKQQKSVQYNGGFLPDIIPLAQGYNHWGTRLNTM